MSKVSVVIRCYNEEEHIGRLLSGIMQQTRQDIEIVIVDSGSTDATLAIASRYPVKIVSIKPEEFSFGRSLNIGCQAATGEFIVIASAHVYPVYEDWLEKILEPFFDKKIALVYGKQRGNEITKYSEHQVFAKWFPEQSNYHQNHPFCNNANAAIRKSLWEKLPYDENLTGLEDLDWAKKILSLGYQIAYVAEASIVHVHDETAKRIYNRYFREALAFKKIFPQEHFYIWDFTKLIIANVISDYYHAWHDGVVWKNFLSIPVFRLMQFWGTYRGFARHGVITSELKRTFYYPRMFSRPKHNLDSGVEERIIDYGKLTKEKVIEKTH
jgi:glycosyltransferase involved in cell wall biosynthesis